MIDGIRHLLMGRFRISTQLYSGIGGAVLLVIAASIVGWFSFDRVGDAHGKVNDESVPKVVASFGVAQYSGTLVAAAPRLAAASTQEIFDEVTASIDDAHQNFEQQLFDLEQTGAEKESFKDIHEHANNLISNIDVIKEEKSENLRLVARGNALQAELTQLSSQLNNIVVPAIDDQLFYTMTGYRWLGAAPAARDWHFSPQEFRNYRYMAELQADANIAIQMLTSAFSVSDPSLIEPLRERFEAAVERLKKTLTILENEPLYAQVEPLLTRLFQLGIGAQTGFDVLERQLSATKRQNQLLASNRDIAVQLVIDVNELVIDAEDSVREATLASTQAIFAGRTLLLVISVFSVSGALLIAWLFVGRVLLRRIQLLSNWMRSMAGGDLEAKADIGGQDEVADMAAALEVFRRHALEVQRLNLVEKLADELQEKNGQLEVALGDLEKAQGQIVMQQKLAALGELTAGVAHEIRNPLNFINNFSEVSEELIEELSEVLEEQEEQLEDEQKDLINEIKTDLTSNLERIRFHGNRANRIVEGMLSMGRGSGERMFTDINTLLDEHAKLAYHSARATDPDFQLDLQMEFDSEIQEIEVVSQDLGRVFLNMVGNACHATDDKRKELVKTGAESKEPYMPTVWLVTKGIEDAIEIRIRDNGTGIPPEIIESIFNPFFTTKPTDQGTGLGLAISNDIVHQHGGSIRVESEPGEFTEMIITLPLVAPPIDASENLVETQTQSQHSFG